MSARPIAKVKRSGVIGASLGGGGGGWGNHVKATVVIKT